MAYVKNNWVDREGTTRYFETVDDDGALIFTPDYTQVTELGTPVNADNMNHIEEGIAAGSFTKYDSMSTYALSDLVTTFEKDELKVYKSLVENNTGSLKDKSFWKEVEFSNKGGSGYVPFDPVMKDHILTFEESKGLVPFGDYAYKTGSAGTRYGYPEFYDKCIDYYNEAQDKRMMSTSFYGSYRKAGNPLIRMDLNCNEAYISRLSTTNYIYESWSQIRTTVTKTFRFYTGDNITTQQCIDSLNGYCYYIGIKSSKMLYYSSNNETSWNIASAKTGTTTLTANTWYTITFTWWMNGSLSVYIDGNLDYSVDGSGQMISGSDISHVNLIGVWTPSGDWHEVRNNTATMQNPFLGQIDIGQTYTIETHKFLQSDKETYSIVDYIDIKQHTNGFKFYDISQVNSINTLYNATGMAWLYGIDTTNERIRMPRNDTYFMCGNAGEMVQAGLPNIVGEVTTDNSKFNAGSFYGSGRSSKTGATGDDGAQTSAYFDASRSSSIYGNSNTVQTDAVKLMGYICVGNTETEVASTEVTEVTTTENDTIPLFTGMYFDFKPNNISWLAKDTVQSKSGKFYETTYNELVKCLNVVDNKYNIKVVDVADMVEGTDYSLYWKVDQVNMTFTTPKSWGLVTALQGTQRVLVAKKEPTETDSTWYNLYSDGWLEQGGQLIGSKSTLVFSIPYRDINYNIQISVSDSSPTDYAYAVCSWNDKTINSVTVYCGYNKTAIAVSPYDWVTTGYAEIPSVEDYTENAYLYFKVGNAVANKELIDVGALTEVVNNKISRQDCPAYIVKTYVDGYSWYRVYSDGWCEQGGFISSVTSNTLSSATISFLKPFKNTNYFVSLEEVKNNNTENGTATGGHAVYTKNTNYMVIATYSWTNGRLWEAKGYIA